MRPLFLGDLMTSESVADQPAGGIAGKKINFPKVSTIAIMHMAQYFPEAFVAIALPAVFRQQGLPLEDFWLLGIPLMPRTFKFLIALLVDNYGSTKIGFRKTWIIPCTTLGAALYLVVGFIQPVPSAVYAIVGILLLKTLIMTAQDIAIDGFAAEQFEDHERSTGASMIVFLAVSAGALGSIMLSLVDAFGWTFAMTVAAALLVVAVLPGIIRKEPPPPAAVQARRHEGERASLIDTIKRRENHIVLPFLYFFGFQGTFHGAMWAVFMVDMGATLTEIGTLAGVATISGSAAAALTTPVLIRKLGMKKTGIIGIFPIGLIAAFYVWLGTFDALPEQFDFGGFGIFSTYWVLFAFIVAAAFTGGIWAYAVNTSRFRWPSKRQAATDYAVHSSVWNFGIWCAASLAGPFAAFLNENWSLFFILTYGVSILTAIAYVLVIDPAEKICVERDEREAAGLQPAE